MIVPVRNSQKYLRNCTATQMQSLKSIFERCYCKFDVVMVLLNQIIWVNLSEFSQQNIQEI